MSAETMGRVVRTLRRHVRAFRATAVAEVAAEEDLHLSSAAGTRRAGATRSTAADRPFRVLVACLLSLRTQDTTTGPAAARLFRLADTPAAMQRLAPRTIERAIFPVGFYRTKARALRRMCHDLLTRFGGRVPADLEALITLPGVGRKTANLVVTVAYGRPGICVDTHVHRITNRLGFVRTRTPDETEVALRVKLPRRYWIRLNDLLVAFGQNVCRPLSPHCSRCPVAAACRRVGVSRAR